MGTRAGGLIGPSRKRPSVFYRRAGAGSRQIAGDLGISVSALGRWVHSGLHFNLALVEAALYRDGIVTLIEGGGLRCAPSVPQLGRETIDRLTLGLGRSVGAGRWMPPSGYRQQPCVPGNE